MAQDPLMQDPDALYQSFDKNLYRIDGNAEEDDIMQMMQADPTANNSANVQTSASDIGTGVGTATVIQASGSIQQGKATFDNTVPGFILGTDPKTGNAKFYIGNTTSYLNWNGDTGTLTIKGSISASSIDIPDTTTANSFHTDSSGNTWWGATTLANATASITAAGVGTFAGLYTINKKAITSFETSTRFAQTTGGTGSHTFGNQGVTIGPGATATSFSKMLWKVGNVFTNNPLFTFTCIANSLHAASGSARSFFGMGQPSTSGSGITYTSDSHIGVTFNKDSGVVNVGSEMNDGNAGGSVGANFTTLSDTDVIELFIKVTATKVFWYYRKNGGALTLGDTQTTHIPTGTGEDAISFCTSNAGTAFDFSLIMQCAGYEH